MKTIRLIIATALILSFSVLSAGESGVTQGSQYQAYRVVLDTDAGVASISIEPGAPYFGFRMNNLLLDQIEADCGSCTVTNVIRLQPSPGEQTLQQYPDLRPFSYLWSD